MTQKLILDNPEEILNVNTIDDPVEKGKARVFSDSVLCLVKMNGSEDTILR